MAISTIDASQRKAARIVGLVYLLALPPAMFAEFYVLDKLVDDINAAVTAKNIIENERLFRLGIASNLSVFILDIILITALYVVLKPVNRTLALLAAFWGLIETAVLVVTTLNDFQVLRILSADYMRIFAANRLQALARLSISAHGAAYNVGLIFAGLRSTVFAYLWLKSNYIPKALALLGLFGSALLAARTFAVIIFPELAPIITVYIYAMPIFIFELTMGFWLLIRGIRPSGKAEPVKPSDRAQAGAV